MVKQAQETPLTTVAGEEEAPPKKSAEEKKPEPARKQNPKTKTTKSPGGGGKTLGWAALILALAAISGSAYLGYRGLETYQSVNANLSALRESLRTLDDHPSVIELKQRVLEQDAKLETEFAAQQAKIDALQQSFQTMQGIVNRDQRGWILAEVEYLMRLANTRLRLMRDIPGATQALIIADRRLNDLADPAQLRIREVLANEITALKSLNTPDIDGIALQLLSIANRLYLLPSAKLPPIMDDAEVSKPPSPEQTESFWSSVWRNLKETVGLSRSDAPAGARTVQNELFYIEQLTRLELEAARQAVLRLDIREFEKRTETARKFLDEHYDRNNEHVIRIRADLAALQEADLSSELPDISGSLRELQKQQLKYQPDTQPADSE